MSKYCKICHDSGNPNYSSHNIREWNCQKRCWEVVCPYLMNLKCTKCGIKGHTVKYCTSSINIMKPVLAVKSVTSVKPIKIHTQPLSKKPTQLKNKFDVFNSLDTEIIPKVIEYTADGEYLGSIDEIIWGYGFTHTIKSNW